MTIRNFVLAGALAAATALSAGVASAAPSLPLSTSGTPAVTQAHFGGYYHKPRICYVPFFVLVRRVGLFRARLIEYRCNHYHYY
jgi:hypothetical protein